MNLRCTALCCIAIALIAGCFAGAAETRVLNQPPAVLTLTGDHVVGEVIHLRFSSPLRLEIDLDGDFAEVDPAQVDMEENRWQIVRRRKPEPFRDGNRTGWRQVVELEALQPGAQSLRSVSVRYRGRDGVRNRVEWKDVKAEVAGPVGSDEQDIRGDVDIEALPASPSSSVLVGWIILASAVVLVGALGWHVWVRGRHRAVALRPDEWALRELERLCNLDAPALSSGASARLSAIVREYIERRFALPATQRTTEEFLRQTAELSGFPAAQREQLQEFLQRCDLAKFTGRNLDGEDWRTLLELARAFVVKTTPTTP